LRFGLALHVGDVAYGNIGGAGRLDFTCIGPAVNLAARIEGLTGKTGRPVLLSAEFVKELGPGDAELIGEFELKGLTGRASVYAPRA
jgi:adenylate cyclase